MNLRARFSNIFIYTVLAAYSVTFPARSFAQEQSAHAFESADKRAEALLSQMTLDEKLALIGGVDDFYTRPIPRLGIPSLRMSDGPMGVHDYGPTTAYAAGIALAASWDTDLAKRVGISMGHDARARGVHFILAPGMNIYRSPLNGRNFEYFGEDPYLASRFAVAFIEGIQSQQVIATAKHFLANNSEYGRMDHSSDLDERTAREIYLPAFEASVKEAHAGALMDAYNLVNGTYMTENGAFNETLLRKEWGFRGILMSDWGATHDGIAAANNGLDLEMPSALFMNPKTLIPAIQRGDVKQSVIDEKVRRILRTAIAFGFFDRPQTVPLLPVYSPEGRQVALEEAREGMVLLKNERQLLPLDRAKIKTLLVLGPNAYPTPISAGGSAQTDPFNSVSYLEGISGVAGPNVRVLFPNDAPSLTEIIAKTHFVSTPGGAAGLKGEYFSNEELKGEPALVRQDAQVDFRWETGSFMDGGPVDHFSARWTGFFEPAEEDDYKFSVSADDGVRLYVDDEIVIDDWKTHAETLDTKTIHLASGKSHKIRLEYFESTGSATARFGVAPASISLTPETKKLAASVDAVVICVGFNPNSEGEATDRTFRLPTGQDAYIQEVASVNKNIVVVINSGGGVDMTRWIDRVPAVLEAWYPGQEAGTALGQLLFGDHSPSGKLPATFEKRAEDNPTFQSYYPQKGDKHIRYAEGIFVGYRGYENNGTQPLFPFGFGLSFTSFAYSDLRVTEARSGANAVVDVTFRVKNTGSREGAEVAELYVADPHAPVPRPPKELKGFVRVNLKPGESREVTIPLNRRSFAYYEVAAHAWIAAPDEFGIFVGSSSANIQLRGTHKLSAAMQHQQD